MTLEQVLSVIPSIRPGVFTKLSYKTELPVKAEYKNQGYTVTKFCDTTARIGVKYGNLAEVKSRLRPEGSRRRKDNMKVLVEHTLYQNTDTEKIYLHVFPFKKNHKSKVFYIVHIPGANPEDVEVFDLGIFKELVRKSYFTEKDPPAVFSLNIENINQLKDTLA